MSHIKHDRLFATRRRIHGEPVPRRRIHQRIGLGDSLFRRQTPRRHEQWKLTPTGFDVYLKWADGASLTGEDANSFGWYVNWVGVENVVLR